MLIVLVTEGGNFLMSKSEEREAGARFLHGRPANLQALLLMDFAALICRTDPEAWA